jgi:hypothetical protein
MKKYLRTAALVLLALILIALVLSYGFILKSLLLY